MKSNISKLKQFASPKNARKSPYYNSLKFKLSKSEFIDRLKTIHGISLERMNSHSDKSVYIIKNTNSALMLIPGPTNPGRHISEINEVLSDMRHDGYSLYVVFVRENAWPENSQTFSVYKYSSRKIASIWGLKGVFHRDDFHQFYDQILAGKKLSSNVVEELVQMEAYKTIHSDSNGNVDYESLNAHYRLNSKLSEYI